MMRCSLLWDPVAWGNSELSHACRRSSSKRIAVPKNSADGGDVEYTSMVGLLKKLGDLTRAYVSHRPSSAFLPSFLPFSTNFPTLELLYLSDFCSDWPLISLYSPLPSRPCYESPSIMAEPGELEEDLFADLYVPCSILL